MCIVIDLRETGLVSLVNLRLHTMLPTVLTVDPSARVTTRRSLAAVGVRSASCLAVASFGVRPLGVAGRLSWFRPVRRSSCRWGDWAACQLRACALDLVAPIQEGLALLPLLGDGIPDNSRRWEASEVRTPSPLYGLSRCCVRKVDC